MAKFAENTDVPVEKSRAEIEGLINRYGATSTAFFNGPEESMIAFEAKCRRVMFRLPLPQRSQKEIANFRHSSNKWLPRDAAGIEVAWGKACRQRWRALTLVIKAKLEAVEAGISLFEDEFLANIVMPDGQTVAEHVRPTIAAAYET